MLQTYRNNEKPLVSRRSFCTLPVYVLSACVRVERSSSCRLQSRLESSGCKLLEELRRRGSQREVFHPDCLGGHWQGVRSGERHGPNIEMQHECMPYVLCIRHALLESPSAVISSKMLCILLSPACGIFPDLMSFVLLFLQLSRVLPRQLKKNHKKFKV